MDKILLHGMEFYGYHGVFPAETEIGQRFLVDLECSLDLHQAAISDHLDDTVNYGELYQLVREYMEIRPPVKLLERLAEEICQAIFKRFHAIKEVKIRLIKTDPPIPGHYKYVGIEMVRRRINEA
jgi:dihydroneopterin aldolase